MRLYKEQKKWHTKQKIQTDLYKKNRRKKLILKDIWREIQKETYKRKNPKRDIHKKNTKGYLWKKTQRDIQRKTQKMIFKEDKTEWHIQKEVYGEIYTKKQTE